MPDGFIPPVPPPAPTSVFVPPPTDVAIVEKHAATTDQVVQERKIKLGHGNWSHGDELPLRLTIKRTGWYGRSITVTTTETVWYRDAITFIEVPAGFTYDLASIPRAMWAVVSPWDVALESLFHDLLYRAQKVKRRTADQTLFSMMEDRGVPWHIRWAVYLSVRIFGGKAWRKWAAENEKIAQHADEDGEGEPPPEPLESKEAPPPTEPPKNK